MAPKYNADRKDAEERIREAFRGVTREGGVSWSEAAVIDNIGTQEEADKSRAKDTESCWEDLVDDRKLDHELADRFSFLDPIGFRYYLAPAMIRCLRARDAHCLLFTLTVYDKHKKRQVGLLDDNQARAVARFVRLMIRMTARSDEYTAAEWQSAYDAYWHMWGPPKV